VVACLCERSPWHTLHTYQPTPTWHTPHTCDTPPGKQPYLAYSVHLPFNVHLWQPGVTAKAAAVCDASEKLVWQSKYQDLHRQFENVCARRDELLSELRAVQATLAATERKLAVRCCRALCAVLRPMVARRMCMRYSGAVHYAATLRQRPGVDLSAKVTESELVGARERATIASYKVQLYHTGPSSLWPLVAHLLLLELELPKREVPAQMGVLFSA
jgi:hypothetical protein